jgi:RHS repeat-associated protein
MRTFRPRPCRAERNHVTGTWSGGHYAPWLGRWMSADPIGLGDGTKVYAYVRGNPVTYVDPGGTQAR